MWRRTGVGGLCTAAVASTPCGWTTSSSFCAAVCVAGTRGVARRVPPPLPPSRGSSKLPPPPPLPGAVAAASAAAVPWKSPQEVLAAFIDYIPTFYVPMHCVAAILSEECRRHFIGRGRFVAFLKRYRFFFDLRIIDGVRCDVKLRDDLSHPRRGVADEKFAMTDVGDVINYVARPEFITSVESIEQSNQSVALKPASAPPAVHVRLEERVPVLERLKALVPPEFALLDHVEENVPEDVLFHPYFDCQGGLAAVASKFPEFFQVVDGMIRRRPPHLAPLALNDFTLDTSPIPSVAQLVREQVCESDIPQWVSITSLYEQLSREQKQQIKREHKSFAGFLRAHGKSLSLSQDMLQVARWIPQRRGAAEDDDGKAPNENGKSAESGAKADDGKCSDVHDNDSCKHKVPLAAYVQYEYSHTQIINELFDKFPPHRTLNLEELMQLIAPEMRPSLPKKLLPWLASFPSYFVVDDATEKDPLRARVRRASDRQPLDVALVLYQHTPEDGIAEDELMQRLPSVHREHVRRIGLQHIVNALPEWLALSSDMRLTRLQTEIDLERAIHTEESKLSAAAAEDDGDDAHLGGRGGERNKAEMERRYPKLKYEGRMSSVTGRRGHRGGN